MACKKTIRSRKDDVRMVVAFDSLNKFIRDVPGKITKTNQIYSSLAQWENIGEIDFRDCYHQVRMANFTEEDRIISTKPSVLSNSSFKLLGPAIKRSKGKPSDIAFFA